MPALGNIDALLAFVGNSLFSSLSILSLQPLRLFLSFIPSEIILINVQGFGPVVMHPLCPVLKAYSVRAKGHPPISKLLADANEPFVVEAWRDHAPVEVLRAFQITSCSSMNLRNKVKARTQRVGLITWNDLQRITTRWRYHVNGSTLQTPRDCYRWLQNNHP